MAAAGVSAVLVGAGDEENLSVRYLASALEEAGHSAFVVSCSRDGEIDGVVKFVSKVHPELVGISIAFQSLALMYFELVKKLRDSGYSEHIVVGGHFPTFEYRRILEMEPGVDSVGRFEGERTVIELAGRIAEGRGFSGVVNLVYRTPEGIKENECVHAFPDLDKLPFPKRDSKPQVRLGEKFATLVSSRGCWHSSCLYCCIGAFHSCKSVKFAVRSPENIAEEIALLYRRGFRLFQFHDDNFMPSSSGETLRRLSEVKENMESRGVATDEVAFLIKARPDTVTDDVALALEDFGVVGVFLGIENASESGLKSLIRGAKLDAVEDAVFALRKNSIAVTYNLLIFHPKATLDEINSNILFVENHLDMPFDFGRAEVVAGSPLERMLNNEGRLTGSWPRWDYEVYDPVVERMCKISRLTFRRNGSPYNQLAESSIALAYQAYALRRLHPSSAAGKLVAESDNLVGKVNSFIVREMVGMYGLAVGDVSKASVDSLYEEVAFGCRRHLDSIRRLSRRMLLLQQADRIFESFGVNEDTHKSWLTSLISH